jgi:hypothetical protein
MSCVSTIPITSPVAAAGHGGVITADHLVRIAGTVKFIELHHRDNGCILLLGAICLCIGGASPGYVAIFAVGALIAHLAVYVKLVALRRRLTAPIPSTRYDSG